MKTYTFEGKNIEECLEGACEALNLSKEDLNYNILQKKSFFKPRYKIEVSVEDILVEDLNEDINLKKDKEILSIENKNIEEHENIIHNAKTKNYDVIEDGSAFIQDGIIMVTNPKNGGDKVKIVPRAGITLIVNEKEVEEEFVTKEDKIEIKIKDKDGKRYLNTKVSEDKLTAYINIDYECGKIYKLKDEKKSNRLILDFEEVGEKQPPAFTSDEVITILNRAGIIQGIKKDVIQDVCNNKKTGEFLIAEGQATVETIEDELDIKFQEEKIKKFREDETIDYRNFITISNVKKDEILAEIKYGKLGTKGVDVLGKEIKVKSYKKLKVRCGNGVKIEENKVKALIQGKPSFKNNIFSVDEVYEINGDIDLKRGNVNFVGQIIIMGNINPSMEVTGFAGVTIEKNVDHGKVSSRGDVIVKGNILGSTIRGGIADNVKQNYIDVLEELKFDIEKMRGILEDVRGKGILSNQIPDGEVIKGLLETKFKRIEKNYINLKKINILTRGKEKKIVELIKNKLIGLSPINIKCFTELDDILNVIDKKLNILQEEINLPVDVVIEYAQDSNIISSGNVVVLGKGVYVSNIIARNNIELLGEGSIVRGGMLKCNDTIKCKSAGSPSEVKTILQVSRSGEIFTQEAFPNTKFIVGEREYTVKEACREVHVYLDRQGDIVVDKFKA